METDFDIFTPTDREKQVATDIFTLFRETADTRNRPYQFFDGLNLIEYIEDSVHRFTTNIYERENMEDWQSAANTQFTRNKVLAVLGKVMQVLPVAQFTGRGDEDMRKGTILNDLYQFTEDTDDYEEFMTHVLLESIIKGTSIAYEGVEFKERKIRDVKGMNDDISVTSKTEKCTKLFGSIVPLEEFYPGSVSIRRIKDMPFCFWREVIPYTKFLLDWSDFKKSEIVAPHRGYTNQEQRPYFVDYISDGVKEGEVEIIRYYDKMNDEYVILANGIWLNPINTKDGDEEICPIPFTHKNLPFWEVKFDFLGNWFYGKSLPDRLKALQDILNVLTNMLLDQSILTIFPPLLTNGFDDIEDDYLVPGRRTPVDTQGLPIANAFMKLDLGTPSGWHQHILDYTKTIMEEASLDKVSSGHAGVGERTTAQEIRMAADGVAAILQLFARMINYGVKRKALLRGSNILQYGSSKDSTIIPRVLGEEGPDDFNKAFASYSVDGVTLSTGKRGTRLLEFYKDEENLPKKGDLKARTLLAKANAKKDIEIVAVTPDYIRNFEYDVKLVANPRSETSKELEKALQLEKVRVYMSFFPQQIDMNELAAQTAEKMGDDPQKVLREDVINPQPQPQEGGPMEQDPGMDTTPNDNTANNLARGMRGGEEGASEMAQLAGQMQG
jgi:hypothetical protein